MRSKELRAKRAGFITQARAFIDKDAPTAEDMASFDAAMADADKLKAQIDRLEAHDTQTAELASALDITARASGISADEAGEQARLEQSAFKSYLQRGIAGVSDAERPVAMRRFNAALSVGTGTSGGYTVPQGFYDKMTDALKAYGGMTEVATVIKTESGNPLPVPSDNDTMNTGAILTENTQVGTQDITFGAFTLGAYTYTSKLVLVSNQLLQDSAFDLESFLAQKLATRLARILNTHFMVGTGTGQPNGLVTAALVGQTGAVGETLTFIYGDLVELEHSVDPAYRRNAKFMFSDVVLKQMKKMLDGYGRPLWLPGIAVKEPDTINGYAYSINQDMPIPAANATSIAFGDLTTYMIRQVVGTQVLRLTERYADYNQVGFLAFERWDGNLLDAGTHPVKLFKHSAT